MSHNETLQELPEVAVESTRERWKVWVQTGSDDWASNGIDFATEKAASDWGGDLYCRWMLVTAYCVRQLGENPNQ